jgi:hypothetical protein
LFHTLLKDTKNRWTQIRNVCKGDRKIAPKARGKDNRQGMRDFDKAGISRLKQVEVQATPAVKSITERKTTRL